MRRRLIAAALLATLASPATAQLEWRVSVKVVLDPAGNRAATGDLNTDEEIQAAFDRANVILDEAGRGYRFVVSEIVDLANLPSPPSSLSFCRDGGEVCETAGDCPGDVCETPSSWFSAPIKGETRRTLREEAEADPDTYAWRTWAMNVFILGSDGSGTASEMVLMGQDLAFVNTPFHEAGHFLNLCHTHGCDYGGSSPDGTTTGDDQVADTLPDNSGWGDADSIALGNWGVSFAQLPADLQQQVDDMLHNLMAYHVDRTRITPGQLDRMTDSSNAERANITNGRSWFVDASAGGTGAGSSTQPFSTLTSGLSAAGSEDIVLMRSGSYPGARLIGAPVRERNGNISLSDAERLYGVAPFCGDSSDLRGRALALQCKVT